MPQRKIRVFGLALSLFAALLAGNAHADAPPSSPPPRDEPMSRWSDVGVDASYYPSDAVGPIMGIVPFASFRVPRTNFSLDVEAPLAPTRDAYASGNPALGAHLTYPIGPHASGSIGAEFHAPLANAESPVQQSALEDVAATRSLVDYPRWASGYAPITVPIGVELHPIAPIHLRATLETQIFLPTGLTSDLRDVHVRDRAMVFELATVGIEGKNRGGAGGGVDLELEVTTARSMLWTRDATTQLSAVPYLEYDDGRFFARAGVIVACVGPAGFMAPVSGASWLAPLVTPTTRIGVRLD